MSLTEPVQGHRPVDATVLRRVCGQFVTGVTVITSGDGDRASGTTVNSFTSVSLAPPLVLFCLHTESRLRPIIEESGRFAVNFLAGPQSHVAWAFAGRHTARLREVPHRSGPNGLPILQGALAHLACRVTDMHAGGDHSIVVGEVEDLAVASPAADPLIFFRGQLSALEDDPRLAHPIWDG